MEKVIRIEWCENWSKAVFEKQYPQMSGIYTGLFWELAEKAGLWVRGTYGSPMSKALSNLTNVETVNGKDGEFLYDVFKLKK